MNLKRAKSLLKKYEVTCIILKNNEIIYTSKERGVKPLLKFLDKNILISKKDKLILIDKLIGRAALLLAIKGGISEVYTPIMSSLALEITSYYNISWTAEKIVAYIINGKGKGMCPMESAVKNLKDLDEAFYSIKTTMEKLVSGT